MATQLSAALAPGGPVTGIVLSYIAPETLYVYARLLPDDAQLARLTNDITAQRAAEHAASEGWMGGLETFAGEVKSLNVNHLLRAASKTGKLDAMRKAHLWGARSYYLAMRVAARGGHLEAMDMLSSWEQEYAFRWMPSGFRREYVALWALLGAAEGGQLDAMSKARGWGANNYNEALVDGAAHMGNVTAMEALHSWGATNFDGALAEAAKGGHLAAMDKAHAWGATNFNEALAEAARRGHIAAMHKAHSLGATNYDDALYWAASTGQLTAMEQLRLWGATKYARALNVCAPLAATKLREWMLG